VVGVKEKIDIVEKNWKF